MDKARKHVELFAGCGGMAIGMEAAGYNLEFANEVSPMASDTFAHNVLGIDIHSPSDKIKWIHTRYPRSQFDKRLRENLLTHNVDENCELECLPDLSDLHGSLLVGDVRHLNNLLFKNSIEDPYDGDLDLISGGPPCQSFSLAGKRERSNYKNRLPLDFAEVCEALSPKMVLLENVKGILSAFKDGGKKHYAWFEVAKAFALKKYAPICMLLNSKYFGIAQNRPRYIMIGVRFDIYNRLTERIPSNPVVLSVSAFLKKLGRDPDSLQVSDLKYFDIEKQPELFDGIILPKVSAPDQDEWLTVFDAIRDLEKKKSNPKSDYVESINSLFKTKSNLNGTIRNHELRKHLPKTINRFRFYQVLNEIPEFKPQLLEYVTSNINDGNIVRSSYEALLKASNKNQEYFKSELSWKRFLNSITLTKKHSQRALKAGLPSPAQLTIPDDICHYSFNEPRVLTVREMARIQSFPDSFVFRSKTTTGGDNRSYEVPQYTQVGNAVPPLLAYVLGTHINNLLNKINS